MRFEFSKKEKFEKIIKYQISAFLSLDVTEKNESLRRVHYIMHSEKNGSVVKPAVPSTPSSLHLIPSRVAAKQLTLDPGSSSSPFESPVVSSLFLTSSTV